MPRVLNKSSKVIGIVGTRRRDELADLQLCENAFLEIYKKGDSIVSGGCPEGGDRFAEGLAQHYGCKIRIYYPDHNQLDMGLVEVNPRAAYAQINYARNTLIAQSCDVLIAVVAEDRKGGTEDTIKKTLKLGKEVIYV